MSRQGECSSSTKSRGAVQGGNPNNDGGAMPREKNVSVEKAWTQIIDEEQEV